MTPATITVARELANRELQVPAPIVRDVLAAYDAEVERAHKLASRVMVAEAAARDAIAGANIPGGAS